MIVNPVNSKHYVKITPRYFPTNTIYLKIKNSFKGTTDDVPALYSVTNDDKLELSFSYDFTDEANYSINVIDNGTDEVIFRGLILATTQQTQEYSLTESKYKW